MALSKPQERGKILALRLSAISEFLTNEQTPDNFGDFLKAKGISVSKFLSELPEEFRDKGIAEVRKGDSESMESLKEYTEDLNAVYFDQYVAHTEMAAPGEPLKEGVTDPEISNAYYAEGIEAGVIEPGSGIHWNASGKQKRQEIKKAREEKKNAKKKLKDDLKKGKITKEQYQKGVKDARKNMRDKVGSGVGRAVGKLNKFNPATVLARNSFLSLLSINAGGLASAFGHIKRQSGKSWEKFKRKWAVLGGDTDSLSKAIERGKGKKPFPGLKLRKKKMNAAGGDQEIAEVNDPKNAGQVAAGAGGSLVGLAGVLASNPATAPSAVWVGSGGAVLAIASPILKEFAASLGENVSGIQDFPMPAGVDEGTKEGLKDVEDSQSLGDTIMNFVDEYKWWFLGGIGVLTLAGILISMGGGEKK